MIKMGDTLELSTPFLEMRDIVKRYNSINVLNKINLKIYSGEVLALVGENGAGKSTLIKILSGAITANEGVILIKGKKVVFHTPSDAERNKIATVYQEFNLFSYLSVAENLFFSKFQETKGLLNWKKLKEDAQNFLKDFGLNVDINQPVSELSIAEKQMLEIAKALYQSCDLLILDEPTAVLGGEDVDRLLEIVRRLRDRGVAVIFISHRIGEIFGLVDRYLVLKDGEQIDSGNIIETDPDDLVRKMVGREIRSTSKPVINYSKAAELLRIEKLTRKGVLSNINFSLYQGEVLGIAGLRGSGRTELVRAIFGADPIDSGKLFLEGKETKITSPSQAVKLGIGLVPEDRGNQGLFKILSAQHNIFMANSRIKWINLRKEREKSKSYVEKLKIKLSNVGIHVGSLSGGNQQKVVLSKWIETGVKILLLDEPTRGIDVGSKAQIYKFISELCEQGMAVVLISSELPEILENSHRVLVMSKGTIFGELDQKSATEEAIMKLAVGGNSLEN
jgi:ABC-type sugar transport system ATPase subunit